MGLTRREIARVIASGMALMGIRRSAEASPERVAFNQLMDHVVLANDIPVPERVRDRIARIWPGGVGDRIHLARVEFNRGGKRTSTELRAVDHLHKFQSSGWSGSAPDLWYYDEAFEIPTLPEPRRDPVPFTRVLVPQAVRSA